VIDAEGITCIHAEQGLCPGCQEAWEADPQAFLEYGDHPDGLERWRALQAELLDGAAADRAAEARRAAEPSPVFDESEIPY
jgi:hypothetical protein